jgi:hypothetical protein
VPDVFIHAIVDGFAETGPFALIAAAAVLAATGLAVWRALAWPLRELPLSYYLAFGVVVFVVLTAVSRVQLGNADAAPGRYVYVEAALALSIASLAASRLVRSGRGGWWVTLALLMVIGAYNLGGFVHAARDQAAIEQFTRLGVLAAAQPQSQLGTEPQQVPLPVLAPTLTLGEIEQFREAGLLPSGLSAPGPELSVEAALHLSSAHISGGPSSCEAPSTSVTFASGDSRAFVLAGGTSQTLNVQVSRAGTDSAYVQLKFPAGEQVLTGLSDATVTLRSTDDLLCRVPPG